MGNTTTHTQYTTSNTSSAPHPSTPHAPNPTHSPTTRTRRTHHPRTQNHRPVRAQALAPLHSQHPYPNTIPNRYYRHCQRSFDPDAFQHLFQHILHAVPTDQPYGIALDGTTVPRTGNFIPGAHGTPNPTNAPFARGLRQAQRFVMLGWLEDDPNARCVPVC